MRRSQVRSGDRNGDPGAPNGDRNDARDAQSGVRSGAQDATSDGTRATAPPPPNQQSNHSFAPTTAIGPPQRAGRRKPVQRAASAGLHTLASRARASAAPEFCTGIYSSSGSRHKCKHTNHIALNYIVFLLLSIPCAMVYGLCVLSPVSGLVSHRRTPISACRSR
jgi:hypothetical protein